ncbi:hypothetical protein F5Y18DRAFT_435540 [Xylariaceae sp. FL1019]|nr:hypothetical protein F5Y18DRAFT_435540 [Xylariaceae sp. FL1019]
MDPDPRSSVALSSRRSTGDIQSDIHAATDSTTMDPPRPAKAGFEWVWFPAGYWAEREIVELATKEAAKGLRWKKGSARKSSSGSNKSPRTKGLAGFLSERVSEQSDKRPPLSRNTSSNDSMMHFPQNRFADQPLPSPYLSEKDHVQSLQRPSIDVHPRSSIASGGGSIVFTPRTPHPPSPLQYSDISDESGRPTLLGPFKPPAFLETIQVSGNPAALQKHATINKGSNLIKNLLNWRLSTEHEQGSKSTPVAESQLEDIHTFGEQNKYVQRGRVTGGVRIPSPVREEGHKDSTKSYMSRSAKLFRRSQKNRKNSGGSQASASSSVIDTIRYQSGLPSPVSGAEDCTGILDRFGKYRGASSNWSHEFPGGEAKRIQTPHITQSCASRAPRSFFFDVTPPPQDPPKDHKNAKKKSRMSSDDTVVDGSRRVSGYTLTSTSGSDWANRSASGQSSGRSNTQRKQWWDVPVPIPAEFEDKRVRHAEQRGFEFDIAEHLPTSPMCPANKRHVSGGTGVCVFHGRRKRTPKPKESPGMGSEHKGNGNRDDADDEDDEDDLGSDIWK